MRLSSQSYTPHVYIEMTRKKPHDGITEQQSPHIEKAGVESLPETSDFNNWRLLLLSLFPHDSQCCDFETCRTFFIQTNIHCLQALTKGVHTFLIKYSPDKTLCFIEYTGIFKPVFVTSFPCWLTGSAMRLAIRFSRAEGRSNCSDGVGLKWATGSNDYIEA